jgi:hypothetical protein
VTTAVVVRYGGLRAEQLQARMLASGDEPAIADVERFCERARELFRTIISTEIIADHRGDPLSPGQDQR